MENGFKLIQQIGIAAFEFSSTNRSTLEFEEAKKIALIAIRFIKENPDLGKLEKEVINAQLGGTIR